MQISIVMAYTAERKYLVTVLAQTVLMFKCLNTGFDFIKSVLRLLRFSELRESVEICYH